MRLNLCFVEEMASAGDRQGVVKACLNHIISIKPAKVVLIALKWSDDVQDDVQVMYR